MARGQQLQPLTLTADERAHLLSLSRRRTSAQGIATRARIVLAAAEGKSNLEVAEAVADDILAAVGRFCSRISDSGH